jgi:hypothetical protein
LASCPAINIRVCVPVRSDNRFVCISACTWLMICAF